MRKNIQNNQDKTFYIAIMGDINICIAEELMKSVADIPKDTETLYVLLSTAGGTVPHGFAIYSLLKSLPYRIVIHNIGNVDSIGNVIFLAGDERYATKYATFLLHNVKVDPKTDQLTRSLAEEKLKGITADEERISRIYKEHTLLKDEDIEGFFETGVVKTADIALKDGIIHDIRDLPKMGKITVINSGK